MSDDRPENSSPPSAADRTVIASPDAIAAAEREIAARSAPPPPSDPSIDPVAGAAAEAALPEARAVDPAAASSFGHGPPGQLVGAQLNDLFEIVRFIARGGMGEVYEGRNLASHERVAIKVILPQFAVDEQFMTMFRREASSLERLAHDALVKYRTLAFDRATKLNYLAIEYVEGGPMSDILDGQPAPADMVRIVLRRLAAGLAAAHEVGVVHRDLSPDNILLPEGQVARAKIIDFGIAKDTNPGEKSVVGDAFAGKFGYAAPEIFGKYKRQVGPWTDVYSLALTVLAYAKGRPLDMGITIVDALEARDTVPDLSFLPPELVPVFTGMLEPDPEVRFRSMEQVIQALDTPGGGAAARPAPAAPPPAVAAAPAFVRRDAAAADTPAPAPKSKLPLFAGGGAALLAVLGIGGYFAFSGGNKPVAPEAPPAAVAPSAAPAAASARPDWAQARSVLQAGLAATPCSHVRIAGTPDADGLIRLTGWHPTAGALPAAPPGYRIDSSGVAQIAAPSAETCSVIDALRKAVPVGADDHFTVRASQTVSIAAAPKIQGSVSVDLGAAPAPTDEQQTLIVNVDDHPTGKDERLVAGPASGFNLAALPFDPKPKRYLTLLIAGRKMPPTLSWPLDTKALAASCAGGGCELASGWIVVTP